MFALVKFYHGEFYITKYKQIKILKEHECLVKYKGGAKYGATLICTDDSENNLKERQLILLDEDLQYESVDVREQNNGLSNEPRVLRSGHILDNHKNENTNEPRSGMCTDETTGNYDISSISDPNFKPDFNSSAETSRNKSMASSRFSGNTSYKSINLSPTGPIVDIRNLKVPKSQNGAKRSSKKDFCIFCKKLVTQFARHLKTTHQNENDVKFFMSCPEKSRDRFQLIKKIRGKGNFLHNTNPEHNTGILITCRQQQSKSKNSADDYIVCTNCQASYSKRTIRIHYRKCNTSHKKGIREVTVMGRQMSGYVHSRASTILQKIIIPGMHADEITRSIKYDELIIIAGNKFCEKYTMDQHIDLIRAHLRLLGRLKLAVMARNDNIKEFADVFHPRYYDVVVEGVREVAGYNPERRVYKAPSNATTLGTLLKKCSRMLVVECIKNQNSEKKKNIEDFMVLYEDDYPTSINKKVMETQISRKREKKEVLPSKEDINKLYTYLKRICKDATLILEASYSYEEWKRLSEACLIILQMFNRRRSGEIERLYITDYNNRESVNGNINPELFAKLPERSRKLAERYERVTIRGKLNRTVPVLLDFSLVQWINTILKYRSKAGVKSNNKYVFGVPTNSKFSKSYLRACPLMRKFSAACGAVMPGTLRGTTLRKHIATYTAMLGIEESQVDTLSNFMGHNKEIHKEIYRVPVPFKDVTDVSQLLLAAMGEDADDNENDSDTDGEEIVLGTTSEVADGISFDSLEDDSEISPRATKRRSTSPFGKTRRERWTDEEKNVITECFGDVRQLKSLPSLAQCSEAIQTYSALRYRSPQTIKTWIDNQRKAPQRKLLKVISSKLIK